MKGKSDAVNMTKKNVLIFAVLILCAVLFFVAMAMPVYRFESNIYTKKSANTDIGSEKYYTALAEVEAEKAKYDEAEIREEVVQRTNSKGVTSTLVTFRVIGTIRRGGYAFLSSGLTGGRVLLCVLVMAGLGTVLAAAVFVSRKNSRALCAAVSVLLLLSLLLLPVFAMTTTWQFNRQIKLSISDGDTAGIADLMARADDFLYAGAAGDGIVDLLSTLSYETTGYLWAGEALLLVMAVLSVLLFQKDAKKVLQRALLYFFVVVMCIIILYPYYVMLITGMRSNAETTDMYFHNLFPEKWRFSNLGDIMQRGVPQYLLNSVILAVGGTCISLFCGVPAAYAMARMPFKGKKAFLGFVIMGQMFSPVVLLVGISRLMNTLHLNDSLLGLMLVNAAFNQAFAIWLLRGTFVSISSEMEQAACIDGCSTVGALLRVLLPMAAPGIVTTLIFVFINVWNEYTISTVLISTSVRRPITVGITQFSSYTMIEWQYLFAASLIATIPVIILFLCIEKHLVAGLTSGGVKG